MMFMSLSPSPQRFLVLCSLDVEGSICQCLSVYLVSTLTAVQCKYYNTLQSPVTAVSLCSGWRLVEVGEVGRAEDCRRKPVIVRWILVMALSVPPD